MTTMSRFVAFCDNPLDRVAVKRQDSDWLAARLADPSSRFLAFNADLKVLMDVEGGLRLGWRDAAEVAQAEASTVLLGLIGDVAHFAVFRPDVDGAVSGGKWIDARSVAMQLHDGQTGILAHAKSLIDWHRRHGFCAVCGHPSVPLHGGYQRRCTNEACKADHFPRTDPVTIMLVEWEGKLLLGRQPQFAPGSYSALAGFVEPGETIEDAVRREIAEEAGIPVGTVRYLASQPWPFPSSLMIGCVGYATAGDIVVDRTELEDARWFERAELAEMADRALDTTGALRIPPPVGLAHHLIRYWLEGRV